MFRYIILIGIVILVSGCSFQNKNIEKKELIKSTLTNKVYSTQLTNLEKDLNKVLLELNNESKFNSNTCSKYINDKSKFLLYNGENEYLSELDLIKNRYSLIVDKLFKVRLLLRDRFSELSLNNNIEDDCISSIRKAYRYSRFLEEFITEIGISSSNKKAYNSILSNKENQLFINPKYPSFELKVGDVLLLRSATFVGATIARIGDDDGQFSHGAVVFKNKENQLMILESLIDKGLVSKTLDKWKEENHSARIIQFRPKSNKTIKLVESFYNKTKAYHNNQTMKYDFQMDDTTKNQLFCSEVIQHTYSELGVPTYKTKFNSFKNHDFLNNLTIKTDSAFSPNDIEIEPKFELISEWRNYDLTRKARTHDAIMTSFMKWMSEEGYELKETFKSFFGTSVGYYGRHIFGLNSDQIPLNMPYGFLKTIIQLNDLNNILEEYLMNKNNEYFNKYGYSMTYPKMIVELEKLRKDDLENYKLKVENILNTDKSYKVVFHHLLNK